MKIRQLPSPILVIGRRNAVLGCGEFNLISVRHMKISFHAGEVAISHEDWGLIVGLKGESSDELDYYLMLQRQKEFDEQDVKLGMADVYIEVCGQGMSWYGNIDSFELHPASVEVELSEAAATEVGIERGIHISFPPERHIELSVALREVFAGRRYYREKQCERPGT